MINNTLSKITRRDLIELVTLEDEILDQIIDLKTLVFDGFFFLAKAWKKLSPQDQRLISEAIKNKWSEDMEATDEDLLNLLHELSNRDLTKTQILAELEIN